MEYLNVRPYLFRRPARRRRMGWLLASLGAFTLLNSVSMNVHASTDQDNTFNKLVDRPVVGKNLAEDGRGRFGLAGSSEKFEVVRTGRKATIRFLCDPSPTCTDAMRKAQPLVGEPTGRGDTVFKSSSGEPVLRVTATGGATLFGGAPFVPSSVPKSGRAVVPAS